MGINLALGINFQIHFVNLVSPVSINIIHLSLIFLCHYRHSHHPSPLHSFTPGSKLTFSTNPSHLNFSSLPTGLPSWSWDWTGLITLISLFLDFFLLHFLFIPCVRLRWLSVSFLLHVKYTVSYRIVFASLTVLIKLSTNRSRCVAAITFFSLVNNPIAAVRRVIVDSLRYVV